MPSPTTVVPAVRHRRRGTALLAIAAWQVWLWSTRLYNLVADPEQEYTAAFVVVHLVLFGASFGMAAWLGVVGWRMRREATSPDIAQPRNADDRETAGLSA